MSGVADAAGCAIYAVPGTGQRLRWLIPKPKQKDIHGVALIVMVLLEEIPLQLRFSLRLARCCLLYHNALN